MDRHSVTRRSLLVGCGLLLGCGGRGPSTAPLAPIPVLLADESPGPAPPTNASPALLEVSPSPAEVIAPPPRPEGPLALIAYFHGRCGDPSAIESWRSAAASFGEVVVLLGDEACDGSRARKWSGDHAGVHRRLEALANKRGSSDLPRWVVGYSQGALVAESLLRNYPGTYRGGVLMSGPRPPHLDSFHSGQAIVLMVGGRETVRPLREAYQSLCERGRSVAFRVLPGARHGEFGDTPVESMTEVFEWLAGPTPCDLRAD